MRVFVINLKRAVERREYISNQLNQISQKFELVNGIDWQNIDPLLQKITAKNIKIKNSFRPMTLGELGCNLSHRKVLNWLVQSKEKMIAVLEDDVRLAQDFPQILHEIEIHPPPSQFDIVFLHNYINRNHLVNISPINWGYNLSISKRLGGGALGYVITKSAAKIFLDVFPKPTGPIDDCLHAFFAHGLKTYYLHPPIVFLGIEAKRFSFIEEGRGNLDLMNYKARKFLPKCIGLASHKISLMRRLKYEMR